MGTFPSSPSLPAVTTATTCDPAFFNTLVDNINAIGDCLIALTGDGDGHVDIAADKGIEWADTLKIYFSGGDIIIDDGVKISGDLDVGTTLTVDTISDSGDGTVTISQDVLLSGTCEITGNLIASANANIKGDLDVDGNLNGSPIPNYGITNGQLDRFWDADTILLADLADAVYTIINDLINIGLFQ